MGKQENVFWDFITNFFSSNDFMPHGHCYLWRPEIVWLHVISDTLIAISYYSIPLTLIYFVHKRRDIPFHWIFLMFGAFIFACGTTHLVDIWTLWVPMYRLEGAVKLATGLISFATAIALIPILPRALALPSLQRLAAIVEASDDAIIGKSLEGKINSWNRGAERMYGYTEAEAIGKHITFIVPPDLHTEIDDIHRQLRKGTHIDHLETVRLKKNGDPIHISLNLSPIPDDSGNIIGISAIARDMTDRLRAEEALRESERIRVLAETATAAAHEINQPLTVVAGMSELLLKAMAADDPRIEDVKKIYAAGQRINRIVGQMKNVRQYSTQSYVGNVKMIDFDRAVDKKEDGDEKAGENML